MGSGASKKVDAEREAALNALKQQNSALQARLDAAAASEKHNQELLLQSQQNAKQLEEALARAKELASQSATVASSSEAKLASPRGDLKISSPRGADAPNHSQPAANSKSSAKSGRGINVPPINTSAAAPLAKSSSSSSFSNLAAASLSARGAVTARRQLLHSVTSAVPSMPSERLISIPLVSNRANYSFSSQLRFFASALGQRLQSEFSLSLRIIEVFDGRAGSSAISASDLRLFVHLFLRSHPYGIAHLSDAPAAAANSAFDPQCSIHPAAFFTTISQADGLNDIISSIQSVKPPSILEAMLFLTRLFSNHCFSLFVPQKPSLAISEYAQRIVDAAEAASVRAQQYVDDSALFKLMEHKILKWAAAFPPISNLAPLWAESHLCRAFGRSYPEVFSVLAAPFERALSSALEFGSNKVALIVSDAIDCDIALAASLSAKKSKLSAIHVPFLRSAAIDNCYRNSAYLLQTIITLSPDDQSSSCMDLASRSLSPSPPTLGEVACMPQLQRQDSRQHIIVLGESLCGEARRFTNVNLSPGTTVVCVVSAVEAQVQPMLGWKLIPCSFLAGYERASILQVLAAFGFVISGSALSALPPKISCSAAHVAVQHARACSALALPTSCLGEILVRSEPADLLAPVILFIESIVDVTRSSGPLKHMIFDVLLLCSLSWRGASYHAILQFTGSAAFNLNMLLQLLDGFIIQACGYYCVSSQILFRYFQNRFLKQPTESQRLHKALFEFYGTFESSSQDAALEMLYHSCACGSSSSILQVIANFELLILMATSTARPFLLQFLERAQAILGSEIRGSIMQSCDAFLPSTKSSATGEDSLDLMKGMAGNLSWAEALQFFRYCTPERARCCCYFLLHESCLAAPPLASLRLDAASARVDVKVMSLSCNLIDHLTQKGSVISILSIDFGRSFVFPWLVGPICIRALSLDSAANVGILRALKPYLLLVQSESSKSVYMQPSLSLFYAKIALSLADAETSRSVLQSLQSDVISWCELYLGSVHPFTVSAHAIRALHLMIIASVSDAASSIRQAILALRSIDFVPFESKILCDAVSLPHVSSASKSSEFMFSKEEPSCKDAAAYLLRGEWCWRVACVDVARACAALLMYRGESADALPLLSYCRSSCWSANWDDCVGSLSVPSLSLFLAFSSGRLDLALQQIKDDTGIVNTDGVAADVKMWAGGVQSLEADVSASSWRFRVLSLMAPCSELNAESFKLLHSQNMQSLQMSSSSTGAVDSALYLVHSAGACFIVLQQLDVKAFANASATISRQYGSRHVYCILAQLAHSVALLSSGSVSGAIQVFSSLEGLLNSNMYPYSSCLFMIYCSMMSYYVPNPSLFGLAEASAMHLMAQISNALHPVFVFAVSSFALCASALGKVGAVLGIVRLASSSHTESSASMVQANVSPSLMQRIYKFACSAAVSFATGSVAAHRSSYPSYPQLKLDSAELAATAMHWWCERHSGTHAESGVASSALKTFFQGKFIDPFSLFGSFTYISGTIYSFGESEINHLRDMVSAYSRCAQDVENESGGMLRVSMLHVQVAIAISQGDVDAQETLLVRLNSDPLSGNPMDSISAMSCVAVARLLCNSACYVRALDIVRMFGDAKCMSFDIHIEWCRVIVDSAKDCSDLSVMRSCLSCLEVLKKSALESDYIFQVVYHCCCCIIYASEDKFAAANRSFSDANVVCTAVSDRSLVPLHLKYFVASCGAFMYLLRHSYQLALQSYTGLKSICPDTNRLTVIANVYALEMQVILSDMSASLLNSKLEVLTLGCEKFPVESAVFASLSRSRAFLLERIHDLDKSEEQFSKVVLKSDVNSFGSVNEQLAWDQVCLGRLYMQRLQISLAESALIDAIKIYIKIRGDQNSRIALILFELASVYERYGNYVQAWEKACKSIKILDRIPREGHWSACEAYLGLGKFMLVIDNWQSSLEYLSVAATGFDDLQGPSAIATLESAAFAAFVEHLMSCDSESLRKCRHRIFSLLSNMISSSQNTPLEAASFSKDSSIFTPSIAYAKWLSCVGACNIFSCNAIAKRYLVSARTICESFSNSVAATLDPLVVLAYMLHGRYSKAASLISTRIPPGFFSESGRKNAFKFGVEHADLLHAGAMVHYATCNYKYAGELLRASKTVLSSQTSEGLDWTQSSVKLFRIDAIECIICSETGASLKALDSAKAQLDRLRLGNNHLLHHILTASQMQSDIWKGCFSPASKQVIMVCKDMRACYRSSHLLNIRLAQLEAIVHAVCGNFSNAIQSLNFCHSSMYSGWSSLCTAKPYGTGKMALFFMRVAREAHSKLGFGHRELCSCFAIRTFVHAFSGDYDDANFSAAMTQRCVGAVVNSMSTVREETNLKVFVSLSQIFTAMLQLLRGNIHDAFICCSSSVDSMLACGWAPDNFWVGLGRFCASLAAISYGDLHKGREVASSMFDKLTSSSLSAEMLSSCMFIIISAFSGQSSSEAEILLQLKPFLHPSLHMPVQDDADALWAFPFATAAGAVALWASCHTEIAQKFIDASHRFLQELHHNGHPAHLFVSSLSILLSPESSFESVSNFSGMKYDSAFNLISNTMRFSLMGVYVAVDHILKIVDSNRNLFQMLHMVEQLLEELPLSYRDEGLMQLHLWYCHSEICRRLNRCADALQRLNTVEARYVSIGYIRPNMLLMQAIPTVYLAQARCLSSLGRLKDAIGIVRACVISFEQLCINNSLSRQFRVEFGSMLIDVGSFSEASEFFEKGGNNIMITEINDASTLIGIGKLACYRGDSLLLGTAVSAIRGMDIAAGSNSQTSLDFLLAMQMFLQGEFSASVAPFQDLVIACENRFGTSHPRTCECRGLEALVAMLLGTQSQAELLKSYQGLYNCRDAMKEQGLDASSSSVVRTLLAIEAWLLSELGNWSEALEIAKSIVSANILLFKPLHPVLLRVPFHPFIQARPCDTCSLDDIIPVYVFLRCCLKLGLHSIILNEYSTLDSRFISAGATSHPIVIMSKFLRVRALIDCGMGQAARDLLAATDEMGLPGQWSIMRQWCCAHVNYGAYHLSFAADDDVASSSGLGVFSNCDEMLSHWLSIQRSLPITHRLSLRSQFNVALARASLGDCDGVQLLQPVLLLLRQHLGNAHCDVQECSVALADYLPSDARSSSDSESVVTHAMRELARLCGPTSPPYIRAQLIWLRLCCSRGKGSMHFKDIIPTIQSILSKMKGLMWFTAFDENQFHVLHCQTLAQANSLQAAADKLLQWQADHSCDNRLKMHLSIMRSYSLGAQVFGQLGDVKAVERQHDYAISRSFSQRHLLLWAKGQQLLQMAQQSILHVDSNMTSSARASAESTKVSICESAARSFISADLGLSNETLTPSFTAFRCHCKLRAAEAYICSGSDAGLASARDLCESCDALCKFCEPDDPSVRCLMLRTRANLLSACDSDTTSIQELYEESALLASSSHLQRSANMSLLSLRVSLGQYSEAQKHADKLRE